MSTLTDIQLTGFKELDERLRQFPILLQEDIMKKAMVAGAKIYQNYAKEHAPVGTVIHKDKKGNIEIPGTGRNSIRIRKLPQNEHAAVRYAVGIYKKGWYMRLQEEGWQPTGPRRQLSRMTNVYNRHGYWQWLPNKTFKAHRAEAIGKYERVPPNPFLAPAFDSCTDNVIETVRQTIEKWIVKYKGR